MRWVAVGGTALGGTLVAVGLGELMGTGVLLGASGAG
jgi:hypothetical protein